MACGRAMGGWRVAWALEGQGVGTMRQVDLASWCVYRRGAVCARFGGCPSGSSRVEKAGEGGG